VNRFQMVFASQGIVLEKVLPLWLITMFDKWGNGKWASGGHFQGTSLPDKAVLSGGGGWTRFSV